MYSVNLVAIITFILFLNNNKLYLVSRYLDIASYHWVDFEYNIVRDF